MRTRGNTILKQENPGCCRLLKVQHTDMTNRNRSQIYFDLRKEGHMYTRISNPTVAAF